MIKSALSLLVIIILAVIIVNADKLIPSKEPELPAQGQEAISSNPVDYGECFDKDPSTVVFVHSNGCPHCRSIMPVVQELEKENYKFYWAESSDSEAGKMITSCFSGLLSGYVPQFICPRTGKEQTGAMSKEQLKRFADDCIQ